MRILIADDQPLDRSVLKLSLEKWEYEVVEASDGEEALRILLSEDTPNLAILDWMMPGLSGPEICERIRSEEQLRYTYILLLTSKDNRDDIVEGLTAGADDYIVKPVDIHELQVRLRAGRRIIELQEELIAAREELRIQATRDFLTNLWNRGMIVQKLDEELSRSLRTESHVGILMCDIDRFKNINDTHGHPAGDAVLKEVAKRMHDAVRGYDSVGRFGGEEFLIVCPDTDSEGIVKLGERLRRAIADTPIESNRASLNVTVSIGAASHRLVHAISREQFVAEADDALYQAKHGGRNQVQFAEGVLNP